LPHFHDIFEHKVEQNRSWITQEMQRSA